MLVPTCEEPVCSQTALSATEQCVRLAPVAQQPAGLHRYAARLGVAPPRLLQSHIQQIERFVSRAMPATVIRAERRIHDLYARTASQPSSSNSQSCM